MAFSLILSLPILYWLSIPKTLRKQDQRIQMQGGELMSSSTTTKELH
jgi:hypothetical protein